MVSKRLIKSVATMFMVAVVIGNAFGTFAEEVQTIQNESSKKTFQKKQNKEKSENEVFGKIVSIDATNVTIQVATKKANDDKMQKSENRYTRKEGGERPEITEEMKQKMKEKRQANAQNGQQNNANKKAEKSFNIENFVELTDETKTINISQANFGKAIDFSSFKQENNTENNANKQNYKDMMKNAKDKTYVDYKVGNYVSIECTDATYQVAKNVDCVKILVANLNLF